MSCGTGVSGCERVYCRLAGCHRSFIVRGWRARSNCVRLCSRGGTGSAPSARLPCHSWCRCLVRPLPSLKTRFSKAGGRYPYRGLGCGLETRVRKKHQVVWWLLEISTPLTCELLLEGNHIFSHFPCPVVFACVSHYFYLKIILVQWIIDVGSLAFLQELLSLTSDPSWIF